jgi:drug/metabolite transporter (DMT)-like permease
LAPTKRPILTELNSAEISKRETQGWIMAFCAAALFSSKGLVAKIIYQYPVSPAELLSLRMLFASPWYILLLIYLIRKQKKNNRFLLTKKLAIKAMLLGFLGYYLASLLDFIGIQYLSTGTERMILFLYPTFIVLGNMIFFKERLPKKVWVSLTLSYIGVGLAYMGDVDFDKSEGIKGALLVLAAGMVFSTYMLLSQREVKKIGSELFTCFAMLGACVFLNAHYLVIEGGNYQISHWQVLSWTSFMGFFQTVIPSLLMMKAVEWIGASRAAVISGAGPVITLILGMVFLGETLGVIESFGISMTLFGAYYLKSK